MVHRGAVPIPGTALSAELFGSTNGLADASGVAALTGSASIAQLVFRRVAPWAGAAFGSLALAAGMTLLVASAGTGAVLAYLAGTVVGGGGFGVAYLGGLRALTAVIPTEHRAAVMSAFYIVAYAAISLPAIAGGPSPASSECDPPSSCFGSLVALIALVVAAQAVRTRSTAKRSIMNQPTMGPESLPSDAPVANTTAVEDRPTTLREQCAPSGAVATIVRPSRTRTNPALDCQPLGPARTIEQDSPMSGRS
jgi:hypothetical protein